MYTPTRWEMIKNTFRYWLCHEILKTIIRVGGTGITFKEMFDLHRENLENYQHNLDALIELAKKDGIEV